jgi:hypothetical protein
MSILQEEFENIVREIYELHYKAEILQVVNERFKLLESKNCLYDGCEFVIIDEPSQWKKTDSESFFWNKHIKIMTKFGIEDAVFATLELKGYKRPIFYLFFATYSFSFDKNFMTKSDYTFHISEEIKAKHGFDKFIVTPFEIE